jgi:hypothetical protein
MARVEEVETDDDEYGRQLVRNGRAAYLRQLDGGRGPRRRQDYDDLTDEAESVDGGDYDLYDHEDSTVAYAVQLAMRDKEDQLVDKALERIRRAQMLGKKNVRLSQRELDALERRRQQTDNPSELRRPKQTAGAASTRPPSRRKGSGGLPELPPGPPAGPYAPFGFGADAGWNRSTGTAHGRPSSSSSANRPRTPTMQSLRPQQSNSPLRPGYSALPERLPPNGRPQSTQPMHQRPLPDEPQWAPPYYNPMQMSPFAEQRPYQPQLPNDLRVGPQGRMSYPAGMSPIQVQHRQSVHSVSAQPRDRQVPSESEPDSSEEEESEESSEEEDEVQIVQVVERQGPPGVQRRNVSGGTRPRPRRSR